MSKINYVVFDMDGTIIDSMPTHARVFGDIVRRVTDGRVESAGDVYIATAGEPLDDQFRVALQVSKDWVDNGLISSCIEEFWDSVCEQPAELLPRTREGLDELHRLQVSLYVFSGCSQRVVLSKLRSAEIDHYFNGTFGTVYGPVKRTKDKLLMRDIIADTSESEESFARKTVLIGDGAHDIRIAQSWGLRSIGRASNVTDGERLIEEGAEAVVASIADAVPLLSL